MMKEIVLVQKAVSKVFGDFVSKVVSDGVDVLKSAIKDADLDRKSYNQNLQTRLYQLIVDALNRFTYNKYEKQDKLYDAAESIIKGYIRIQNNVDAVKLGLKMLVSDVNSDTCQAFLETLCGEICSDDNSDLYKEIDMLWKRQESEYFRGEFAKIDQNDREIFEQLNDLKEVLDFIKRNMNRQEGDKLGHNGIPIVNRADEYAKKWDKNVFLNNFNEEDENAGVNIKLREIYVEECLPHYIWKNNTKTSKRLRSLLTKYIINNNDRKMLLILGQPGIGKSTLITWIMANLVENRKNVLIYQFASDLSNVNWQGKNLLYEIFATIGLKYNELDEKTLILDGFDEIYVQEDREKILHKLNQELEKMNYLKKFSLILACRENYVDRVELKEIEYITLQAWDDKQIKSFCKKFDEVIMKKDSKSIVNANLEMRIRKIIQKKDILGIPLILYMVQALNIDVQRSSSTVDIYDQIFSLKKGGIYDRSYDIEHRINAPEIKKHIHHISQRIAFWMFENNADEATISQEKFEEICEDEMEELGQKGEDIQRDTLIGNFFKLKHCEGKETDGIQFVHRSIYEYFVVAYFFESICNLSSKEKIAGKMGELLKKGHLSEPILEFIKCKFDGLKKYNLSDITKEVINIMLRDGMTYYIERKYKNIIFWEMNIFANMLEIVCLWNPSLGELDKKIIVYLQCNMYHKLNLKGIKLGVRDPDLEQMLLILMGLKLVDLGGVYLYGAGLREADLYEVNLKGADLREADLREADLYKADLEGADLRKADLKKTNLCLADLSRADLRNADLRGANLREANLKGANLAGADLESIDLIGADLSATIFDEGQVNVLYKNLGLIKSLVVLSGWDEIIGYREYISRQEKLNKNVKDLFVE